MNDYGDSKKKKRIQQSIRFGDIELKILSWFTFIRKCLRKAN